MAKIGFYHLTRSSPTAALPHLLTRTLAAGQRAIILGCSSDSILALSDALWAASMWLPHGTIRDGDAPLQPIWLTTEVTPLNGARYLFQIDGVNVLELDGYERVFDLFDGADPSAVVAARERWITVKKAGHHLSYWQQTETGWREKA